ncbi:MAG: serine protease [Silicimonas sp.]|nr:serine protease [Silicimonas sp.]
MADHFLTKSNIDLSQCLEHGGGLALEAYPALNALLSAKAGPEAARLFAEPLLSRGNDTVAPSVSWYTDVEGTGQPVSKLDDAVQAAIASALSTELRGLRDLIDDPDDGPLVAAALHLSDASDVWSVGGRPVILNWGMLPKDANRDGASRKAHYDQTLGRFLPLAAAPPLSAAERQSWTSERKGGAAMPEESAAPETVSAGGTMPPAPPPQAAHQDTRRMPVAAWLPLVLLLVLAAGVLAWLLIPGSRLFPENTASREITDEATLAAAQGINRALEDRLASLQDSLDRAVCTDDGTLLMPDGKTIEGLLPPDPNDPLDTPGVVRAAAPRSILPPDPERVQVPGPNGPKDTVALLAHIEARTAIVLAPTNGGLSSGTGFFVGPDLLVTNHHVVDGAGPQGVFVTNTALGKVHAAQVLKSLGPFQATGGDFALLRVPGVNQPAFTVLTPKQTLKLQSVIAAGYPGDLLRTDDQFQQLRAGNRGAVPDLTVTDGTVSTEQNVNSARMIAHSAPISKGNSGGPLIDMCGNVVGVNTFIKKGSARTLNFALAASDLMRFLAGTDALPQVVTEVCTPQIQRPAPPAMAEAPAEAAPETGLPKLPPLKIQE